MKIFSVNEIFMITDCVSEAEQFQIVTYFSTSFLKYQETKEIQTRVKATPEY